MGGAFLTAEGETKDECKAKLSALLAEAYELNLTDVRAKVEPHLCEDGKWRASVWVHS